MLEKAEYFREKHKLDKSPRRQEYKEEEYWKLNRKFYRPRLRPEMRLIEERLQQNLDYLAGLTGSQITRKSIMRDMGLENEDLPADFRDFMDRVPDSFTCIKTAVILSRYYGIPTEMLLFHDLFALPKDEFKQLYPTFARADRLQTTIG
jgi:hypothetical protein